MSGKTAFPFGNNSFMLNKNATAYQGYYSLLPFPVDAQLPQGLEKAHVGYKDGCMTYLTCE